MSDYLRNWGLYLRGVRWLWSRRVHLRVNILPESPDGIHYKPGWGPWKFLGVYLTTYLAGVLFGCGVVSLSRWWADRAEVVSKSYKFSRFMTRQLNRVFDTQHGAFAGPRLWNSVDLWST